MFAQRYLITRLVDDGGFSNAGISASGYGMFCNSAAYCLRYCLQDEEAYARRGI